MLQYITVMPYYGILYSNHISLAVISSPPIPALTQPLTNFASAVLTAHPARTIVVVNTGWQSRTTIGAGLSATKRERCKKGTLPRSPNPVAMPPSTFRIIHARSSLSSSSIVSARTTTGFEKKCVALYWGGSGFRAAGGCSCGVQIVRRNSKKNLVSDEYRIVSGMWEYLPRSVNSNAYTEACRRTGTVDGDPTSAALLTRATPCRRRGCAGQGSWQT